MYFPLLEWLAIEVLGALRLYIDQHLVATLLLATQKCFISSRDTTVQTVAPSESRDADSHGDTQWFIFVLEMILFYTAS